MRSPGMADVFFQVQLALIRAGSGKPQILPLRRCAASLRMTRWSEGVDALQCAYRRHFGQGDHNMLIEAMPDREIAMRV